MKIILTIIGMSVVTYLPRMLPAIFMGKITFPEWFKNWLKNIPYAALGALIFPGVLLVDSNHPLLGIIGGLVAVSLSLVNAHIVLIMMGSIVAVLLSQQVLF